MVPFVRIFGASGGEVDLSSRLLSVEIKDEAEDKSDRISIEIDNRARFSDSAVLALPVVGSRVTAQLGYLSGGAAEFGPYLIDELDESSPPSTLVVTGRAADMPKSYRTPKSESYHQETLGAIMSKIAGRNGYQASIDPEVAGIVIRHVDQHNESDMSFATRLAGMHDAVARPVAGRLAVARRGTGKSVSGSEIPSVTLTQSMCANWRFHYAARDEAGAAAGVEESGSKGGVRAFWHDLRSGEKKEVTVGSAPFQDLRYTFQNEAEAKAAVSAGKNKADRGKASFSCVIGGDPRVQAEAVLILGDFRPYIPTKWRIKSVTHSYQASGGFTTAISAELYSEKQEDVAGNVSKTTPSEDDTIDPDAPAAPVDDGLAIHLPS